MLMGSASDRRAQIRIYLLLSGIVKPRKARFECEAKGQDQQLERHTGERITRQHVPRDASVSRRNIRMTQIDRSEDCGNSPKNKMTENIAVALEARDVAFLTTVLDSAATWHYVGGTVTTAEAILDRVSSLNSPTRLTVDRVMSHGKVGAVNGDTVERKSIQRFCHVIEFTSVKFNHVRRIESYDG